MVAPTKIDAEERKHNVTVLITIAGAADIETAAHQHGQSRALEFLHHIKIPPKGMMFSYFIATFAMPNGITAFVIDSPQS